MNQNSTERRKQAIKEAIGWLIIGIVVLYLVHMAGYLTAEPVESAPQRTATPTVGTCRPGVEGTDYCADRFATSAARPGEAHNG
jgi:hypothetical protein